MKTIINRLLAVIIVCGSAAMAASANFSDANKHLEALVSSNKSLSSDTREFYKQHNYTAVWYPNGKESVAAQIAKKVLKEADQEGLDPLDYQEGWAEKKDADWATAEIALTNTFLRFIDHVRVGRVPAKDAARTIKLVSPKTDPVKLLTEALQDGANKFNKLTQMAPDVTGYQDLKTLLQTFKALSAKWGDLPSLKKTKVKVGQSDPNIVALKKILVAYGYYTDANFDDVYTQELFNAVVDFQRHNNLEADGVIGEDTARALNVPIKRRIQQIIINMERLRWLPDDLGERHIIVNVAGYEVLAVTNKKIDIRMRSIVGQVGRKTPLFYAPLKNIVINPSWGVPKSILVRDKLPKIINDPSYIERAGFTVYDNAGNQLDPYHVDWESHGSNINLRQRPGFQNALGRIKLNIDNPYAIYLHGTPTGKLFDKPRRNLSSGCIRLQYPNQLAAWVLQKENGWNENKVQEQINSGRTITVPLKKQLPVYFTYQTVWLSDDGKPHFSPDAYKMDDNLIELLKLNRQPVTEIAKSNYQIRYA
ncbi:L,D-transpeptidase family protein [Candidatus Odyssella thessalonicensis]|uniref:L,D-transpeptidase family protein n=1 Tax=Candidatus Odyssella thessalonicensis TaxID=84647 RepID=UPI000225B182|nr:L,D-transpeptidase family protein [Candidatus Odyssella thessalonicensis]